MPSPVDIASIVLAYAFLGRAYVIAALHTTPIKKPFWAFQPTLRKMLLMGTIWAYGDVRLAYLDNPPPKRARSVALAALKVVGSWLFMWFMFSLAFEATRFFQSAVLRIVVFVAAWNVLLRVATWVSPARRAYPPRAGMSLSLLK